MTEDNERLSELRSRARRLYELGRYDELYALVDHECRDAHREHFGSLRYFIGDVDLVIQAAQTDSINWAQLVRGCLLYARSISQAGNIPDELLNVLARLGRTAQVLGYVILRNTAKAKVDGDVAVAKGLAATGDQDSARLQIEAALAVAGGIEASYSKARALAEISGVIAQSDAQRALAVAENAVAVAGGIEDSSAKASALAAIAQALETSDTEIVVTLLSEFAKTIDLSARASIDSLWSTIEASTPGLGVLLSTDDFIALSDVVLAESTGA